jgi:hypothetical protein
VYDLWTALVDGLPEAQPWSHFVDRYQGDKEGYPIVRARADYGSQPRVRAARDSKDFRWHDDVIGEFAVDRKRTRAAPPRPPSPASPCSTWKAAGWSPAEWAGSG